jgi:hypothetical protein
MSRRGSEARAIPVACDVAGTTPELPMGVAA